MIYVTKRKLAFALRDLLDGKQIIEVAMDYGFETHAGFTRAFKRHYGFPPSLARLRLGVSIPTIDEILQNKTNMICTGGTTMHPEIKTKNGLTVVGYTSRHRMPDVRGISDIPAYWDSIGLDYGAELSTLHHAYEKSRHCEVGCCFDIDEEHGCFTYMLGVGVDEADAAVPERPGTYRYELPGGLYAIFRTPLVEEERYVASIQQAWKGILTE
jgi:AraC family transcriptional regulator